MRDHTTTRRILAKIDRDEDPYIILDRLAQAIRDIDDRLDRQDRRLHAIEQEKSKFLTDTGLNRKLDERNIKRLAKWWDAARPVFVEIAFKYGIHILWGAVLLGTTHLAVKGLSK